MMEAALRNRVDYLDLAGEWPVFLTAAELHGRAKEAGVMILPGIGLTVAASDCLMAMAKERWPDTVRMCLGISRAQVISRGSVASAAQMMDPRVVVRREGELATVPAGIKPGKQCRAYTTNV